MNRFSYSLLLPALCALALAGCAETPSSQAASQPAPAPQVAKNDPDQSDQDVQCDTEMETGSHVHKHTVCTTQQERDAMEQALGALRSHGSGPASH